VIVCSREAHIYAPPCGVNLIAFPTTLPKIC
jgi:hypothetical protein